MEIPSWAFASAGKSLSASVSELAPALVPAQVLAPKLQLQEPANDTLYDEIIYIINDMIPKRTAFVDMLIELYT